MATAPYAANDDPDEEAESSTDDLNEVFERAQRRFTLAVLPQLEMRSLALMARRFVSIPGAQWEGDFGDVFDNAIKVEINLTRDGLEKIYRDYNENRVVPDFRPAGGKGDEQSADTLDGLHRADSYCFKSQQARDNAFIEGTAGGFGAYRLTNEWADPYDKDSDHQRINPGQIIVDADQRVFFDPNSRLYDKADADYGFVITAKARETFEDEYEGAIADWPQPVIDPPYDWFRPDVVKVAEYYEVEDVTEKLLILTHRLSGEEQRFWESELEGSELAEMKAMGWKVSSRSMKRRRIHKYVMSGAEVLADKGYICGDRIPVCPYYGKRSFIDGIERFEGYVQGKMDIQRAYNAAMSKLMETSAQSPRQIPIFAAQQMPPNLATLWSRQVADRHAYALVEPLLDPASGQIVAAGPIGTVPPAQIDPATAAVIQLTRNDLTYDQQDGSDEVKANTSADAMDFAATRVDAKSGIYLDNWAQTVQCEGEIYLGMAPDIYFEPGRTVETMTEDGNDGIAELVQPYTNDNGAFGYLNDFSRGAYKVVVDVTEATATRRDKTVKSCIAIAEGFEALDPELALAAGLTAISNMDGEGMTDLQKFARKKGLMAGLFEPTKEEQQQLQQIAAEAQQQPPSPQDQLVAAKIDETQASATDKKTHAVLNLAQAHVTAAGEDATPESPVETIGKLADAHKDVAEAEQIKAETQHLPQKLEIESLNAKANLAKVHQGRLAAFRDFFNRRG
jgi:hypothetical protein